MQPLAISLRRLASVDLAGVAKGWEAELKAKQPMATLVTPTDKTTEKVEKKPPVTDEKPDPEAASADGREVQDFQRHGQRALADEVCHFLGMQRGQAQVTRFADGECYVQIQENVRGADVFVMQPTCRPVDEHLMELLLMIDALKRASARRITAVIRPYFGYARPGPERQAAQPDPSKLVADLLTTAGANRALIVDFEHTPQLQGFFNIPVDHLFASPVLVDHFRKLALPNLTVVSPDAGGVEAGEVFREEGGRGARHRRSSGASR